MTNVLEIRQLCKTYKNGHVALRNVSFNISAGDFFALLGPNGAGKSTLINIITSLSQKTSGQIFICGYDIDKQLKQAKSCIGVVPQEFNFNPYDLVLDVVVNQAGYYGIPKSQATPLAKRYLEQLGLSDKLHRPINTLSGGMKRRLMIARALVHRPKLLILDEPTAGVDIESRLSLWTFLKEINAQGTSIILTTHYLEEAENLCRNIAIIHHGKILENTSMAGLLQTLEKETFVFYADHALTSLPNIENCCHAQILDERSFEITLHRGHKLNEVFAQLSLCNISITSMRNKTNRLEALFLDRIAG